MLKILLFPILVLLFNGVVVVEPGKMGTDSAKRLSDSQRSCPINNTPGYQQFGPSHSCLGEISLEKLRTSNP